MKIRFAFLAALLSAVPFTAALGQSRYVGWHSDLKTAAAKAAETGKPLMVVFRCVR